MAIVWTDYDNGDSLLTIRNSINSFNNSVVTDVNSNTTNTGTNTTNIATNTAAIAVLENPETILMQDMTATPPAHLDGQMFFADGVLNVQDGYPDVTLQVGREMHMEIVNNTGVTITNGSACRHNGVVGSMVQVVLALADTFNNATLLGIATHDILDGETGLLTTFGLVRKVDTIGNPIGTPLYLSDTVPGTYTEVAPVIRTRVGGIVVSDALEGEMFVNIVNNEALPRTLGSLLEATAPTTIPADLVNGTPITDFTSKIEIITQSDLVAGTITVADAGVYRLNMSLHMVFDNVSVTGKKEFDVDLRNVTTNSVVQTIKGFILKDAETYPFNANGAVELEAGSAYRLELRSELALTNFSFSFSTFYIESILY